MNAESTYWANTPKFWRESNGIEIGEQWPWSLKTQRIVWKDDSFANLMEAWEEHVPLIGSRRQDNVLKARA
jgi:hypothetical protein